MLETLDELQWLLHATRLSPLLLPEDRFLVPVVRLVRHITVHPVHVIVAWGVQALIILVFLQLVKLDRLDKGRLHHFLVVTDGHIVHGVSVSLLFLDWRDRPVLGPHLLDGFHGLRRDLSQRL